jgi:lipopolysaccharide transport system permease protein
MLWWYGFFPAGARLLWLLPLALLAFATALGVGLWLSALNVRYRDVQHAVPFLVQIWLFATPIAYPSSLMPSGWRTVYALNPMVGVVDSFRWLLLGTQAPSGAALAVSTLVTLVTLLTGAFFFRRVERSFADIV